MRKPVFGISDQVPHKPAYIQTQKMVRGLRFRIYQVEGLYYLYSKNKGNDQLRFLMTKIRLTGKTEGNCPA